MGGLYPPIFWNASV